jgi:hypothetical protein
MSQVSDDVEAPLLIRLLPFAARFKDDPADYQVFESQLQRPSAALKKEHAGEPACSSLIYNLMRFLTYNLMR